MAGFLASEPRKSRRGDWSADTIPQPNRKSGLEAYQSGLRLNPDDRSSIYGLSLTLGLVHLEDGDYEAALAALEEAGSYVRGAGRQAELFSWISAAHAGVGDVESSVEALERAIKAGFSDVSAISDSPHFDSVRADPRFDSLIRRMSTGP